MVTHRILTLTAAATLLLTAATTEAGPKASEVAKLDPALQQALLFRADVPKVASNNRLTPTAEESKALATGVLVTYGKYSISEADGSVTLKIEASSFPNWHGTEQKRTISVTGDEMRVINPTPPAGGGTAYVVWRRVK